MRRVETDFAVVGSGVAGLLTGWLLAQTGEVAILTKAGKEESNSYRAQGGIAAAVGEEDSPGLHREDTIRTGAGINDPDVVDILVRTAPRTIRLLTRLGMQFDRDGEDWALGREGSHSANRILHAAGDATGAAMTRVLIRQVARHPRIRLVTHTRVTDLVVQDGECKGVVAADGEGEPTFYLARGVILATGGCGQVYRYTTNDPVTTGDGLAMAFRAGAELTDMEFIQFHPTALKVEQNPMFLVSEAVRGEGAVLVNDREGAFMSRYHDWGDLAPRDVVSRAIYRELQEGRRVFLDARSLGDDFGRRFPTIHRQCLRHGIDPARDPIPVTPAAHFIMGGVRTDAQGRTNIPRLFAVGEVACTGVHGANRLASNSLLEGAVFAQRVAKQAASLPQVRGTVNGVPEPACCPDPQAEHRWKGHIRDIMWETAGIVRRADRMEEGLCRLARLEHQLPAGSFECRNMITVAQMILQSALWREESRGGHYREDFPQTLETWKHKHRIIRGGHVGEPGAIAAIHS